MKAIRVWLRVVFFAFAGASQAAPLSGGDFYSVASFGDGSVWAWGSNNNGQVGDGTTVAKPSPVRIMPPGSGVAQIAAGGAHALALKGDGTLLSWGGNSNGQLGDNTVTGKSKPVQILGAGSGMSQIAAGGLHSIGLKTDGSVWAWGANSNGQLGIGSTFDRSVPAAVSSLPAGSSITAIAAGQTHSLALRSDGSVWGWGYNAFGQVGDGTLADKTTPVLVMPAGSNVVAIAAGANHSLALKGDGSVWAWGWNSHGQLGDGTLVDKLTPVLVSPPASIFNSQVMEIAAGRGHTLVRKADGSVWAWGWNANGQLGDGTTADRLIPTKILPSGITAIAAGQYHSLAWVPFYGSAKVWGDDGSGAAQSVPTPVKFGINFDLTEINRYQALPGTTQSFSLRLRYPRAAGDNLVSRFISCPGYTGGGATFAAAGQAGYEWALFNFGSALPALPFNCTSTVTYTDGSTTSIPVTIDRFTSYPSGVSLSPNQNVTTVPVVSWTAPATAPALGSYDYATLLLDSNFSQPFWGSGWLTGSPSSYTGSALTPNTAYGYALETWEGRGSSREYSARLLIPFCYQCKGSQTIGPIIFTPATLAVGGTTTASATATSGLAVTFSSTTPSICTISGGTVTGIAAGACTIAANQAGNASFNAAPQVTQNITVGKANQTIGPITFLPATLAVGGTTTASATGGASGLPVTFSTTSASCTATGTNGNTITGIATGTCIINANQAGNASYNPAPLWAQTLTVGPAPVPAVSLNRTALTFATRNLAKPSPAQVVTLTNTGAGVLNITGIVASGDFARTTTCATTLASRASCTISVTFTATAMGARTGAITLTSNAAGSPHRIALTGTGKGTRYDFNGDGKSDLLWRNATTGANHIWFMNGVIKSSFANTTTQASSWTIAGMNDFNADGKADLLWRNAAGQTAVWLMNGATRLSSTTLSPIMAASWTVAGTGDFNGDGKADILWRNTTTGANQIWLMNGAVKIGAVNTTAAAIALKVAGVDDFNADGKADILWRNASTGQDTVWLMNGAAIMAGSGPTGSLAAPWIIAGTGDFNGDGRADILWRNTTNGLDSIWYMNGVAATGAATTTMLPTWSVAGVADFNNDGKADITWRGPLGATSLWLMNGVVRSAGANLAPAMAAPWGVAK